MTKQFFLAGVAAAVLLGVGVYHGLATDRWAEGAADNPGGPFADFPLAFGDWRGESLPRETDDDPKTTVINSRFTNGKNGKWVLIAITSGRAGRVAIHDPEHCYLGSGYKVVDGIRAESLTEGKQPSSTFWTGHFEKKKPTGVESIRIYWGWSNDGNWQAPAYPRFAFSPTRPLHKLYLVHPVSGHDSADDLAGYKEFLAQYVSELSRRLAN
ncbi:MAG: exosortase-associated EpsI family protein [Gemmataceae bacterium]